MFYQLTRILSIFCVVLISIKTNCYAQNNEISNTETHVEGLINYWPINGSVTDTCSKYNMSMTGNYKLEYDRFSNSQSKPDSALHVYSGHAALPQGKYIDPTDGGFTIMTWVRILSKNPLIKVFGFGNHYKNLKSLGKDELSLWITFGTNGKNRMNVKYTNKVGRVIWNGVYGSLIQLNVWTHLTISVYGEYASIYENGIRSTPSWKAGFKYQRNIRTKNEIFTEVKKYEWNGMIDELKIFNRSLSPIEIVTEMNVLNVLNVNSTFTKYSSLVNYKDRLKHYWPLNGTLSDLIGHKNILQTNEISTNKVCGFTQDRFGKENSAFHMDGKCYGTLPSAYYFKIENGFTIMFWMKIRELRNTRLIWFQQKAKSPKYFYFFLENPGAGGWWFANPEKSRLGVRMCKKNSKGYRHFIHYDSEETLSLHEWIHVALTVNKNSANLYINGKIIDDIGYSRFDMSQIIHSGMQKSNYIGPQGSSKEYLPYIDINELKIFDCALNNQQISAEANFIQNPSDTLIKKTGQITDFKELTHFWPIKDGSTKDEIDSKGKHLALHGSYSFGRDRFLKEKSALEFRGKGYAKPPTDIYFDSATGGFTIMFWVKYNGIHSGFFSFRRNGMTNRIAMGIVNKRIWLYAGKKWLNTAATSLLETNSWTHIALTMESSTLLAYVDGVPEGIWKDVIFYKAERYDNHIGTANWKHYNLDGSIDEFKMFNKSLNANEINTEMNILNLENQDSSFLVDKVLNYKKVLAHYWPLNGTAKDYAGNKDASTDNHGIYKTCGYTSDRFGTPNSALHMDGHCFLTLPSANYFKTEHGYTIMFWIKLRSIHEDQYILEFGDSSRTQVRGGDRPYLHIRFNGESSQILVKYYEHKTNKYHRTFKVLSKTKKLTSQIKVNKWAHIAFTAGTNVGALYINGIIEDNLAQISQTNGAYLVNMQKSIQTRNYIGTDFRSSNIKDQLYQRLNLHADLDELKMFNKPLDQHRIIEEMNHDEQPKPVENKKSFLIQSSRKSSSLDSKDNLIAYWPIEKSTEDSISGKNIKIAGDCKLGQNRNGKSESSLVLNDCYGTLPQGVYYEPADGGFTIMFWVNFTVLPQDASIIKLERSQFSDSFNLNVVGTKLQAFFFHNFQLKSLASNKDMELNKWTHCAFSIKNDVASIFIDGVKDNEAQGFGKFYSGQEKLKNFIGYRGILKAELDELKIFNRGLEGPEILEETKSYVCA